jgi:hypothetical protein
MARLRVVHSARGGEGGGDLVVELDPVGDDDDGPVAGDGALDLLRVEDHGEALAAPWVCQRTPTGGARLQGGAMALLTPRTVTNRGSGWACGRSREAHAVGGWSRPQSALAAPGTLV